MPRKPSGDINEVRTRLNNNAYHLFQMYAKLNNCPSEASAARDLISYALNGLFALLGRTLPAMVAQHNAGCMVDETRTASRPALSLPMTAMEIQLPTADAANLQSQASAAGVPTARFLGITTLLGAFGALHPEVHAFCAQAEQGVDETKRDMNRGAQ
ncbi:hypothetical protein [Uliginosibacterium gangwonense]|uniref:hypothetical protein n=1 Tax=Uliginosibacterium gangwonense TaxID=392736 RepID=UPI0003739FD0|nr:hypothetical protein [Uliginosibacterium gangwonense]